MFVMEAQVALGCLHLREWKADLRGPQGRTSRGREGQPCYMLGHTIPCQGSSTSKDTKKPRSSQGQGAALMVTYQGQTKQEEQQDMWGSTCRPQRS